MVSPLRLQHHDVFRGTPDALFDRLLTLPLERVFDRRHLAIPAIKETRAQDGPWGTAGQTRTIVLADGGTMRETLTAVEEPRRFGYTLDDVHGPIRPLIGRVEGEWRLAADGAHGSDTRITWSWLVHPRPLGRPVMPVFARMWRGMARNGFEDLRRLLA